MHSFNAELDLPDHSSSGLVAQQPHPIGLHLASDLSHAEHHDDMTISSDASRQAVLEKISADNITFAIFIAVFSFIVFHYCVSAVYRRRNDDDDPVFRFQLLSPPLRAPPH